MKNKSTKYLFLAPQDRNKIEIEIFMIYLNSLHMKKNTRELCAEMKNKSLGMSFVPVVVSLNQTLLPNAP